MPTAAPPPVSAEKPVSVKKPVSAKKLPGALPPNADRLPARVFPAVPQRAEQIAATAFRASV